MRQLVESQTFALPSFAHQGGPFADRVGTLVQGGQALLESQASRLNPSARATLAATYCAQLTAWLIHYLWAGSTARKSRVVVEGPLAHNTVFMQVLQCILPDCSCLSSTDALEGTARGAWLLSRWGIGLSQPVLKPVPVEQVEGLLQYHDAWLHRVNADDYN